MVSALAPDFLLMEDIIKIGVLQSTVLICNQCIRGLRYLMNLLID